MNYFSHANDVSENAINNASLNEDEVSGYVALKLMHRDDTTRAGQYVEFLSNMAAVSHDAEWSFYDYTEKWLELVDRSGLFHVNDATYVFFHALEIQTREHLPQQLKSTIITRY